MSNTEKHKFSEEETTAILEALKDPAKRRQVVALLTFERLTEENKLIAVQKIEELAKEQGIDVDAD